MWIYWDVYHVIMEFIVLFVGELVDFWCKRVSLLKHALAECHLFFYNLLVFNDFNNFGGFIAIGML